VTGHHVRVRGPAGPDGGSVLLLGLGLGCLALLVASLVTAAARTYLDQRALAVLADGTALAAAAAVEPALLYTSPPGGTLPIGQAAAGQRAQRYLAANRGAAGLPAAELVAVRVVPAGVAVTVSVTEPASVVPLLGMGSPTTLTVTATAAAQVAPQVAAQVAVPVGGPGPAG
jgi:hypothetical protein